MNLNYPGRDLDPAAAHFAFSARVPLFLSNRTAATPPLRLITGKRLEEAMAWSSCPCSRSARVAWQSQV